MFWIIAALVFGFGAGFYTHMYLAKVEAEAKAVEADIAAAAAKLEADAAKVKL